MARTGTRVRQGVRPNRPRQSAPRGRPSVGQKRQGPSLASLAWAWLARVESLGLFLVAFALASAAALLFLDSVPSLLRDVVRSLGVLTFALLALAGAAGVLIWRQQLALVQRYARPLLASLGLAVVLAGVLSLLRPGWSLGGVSLREVSAGGDLGDLLTSSLPGAGAWLALALAAGVLAWPQGAKDFAGRAPGALATVWSWNLPGRAYRGTLAVIDFAFPTKPPPDEGPLRTPPGWLPDEFEDDDEVVVAATGQQEPEIPDERLKQVSLPFEEGAEERSEAPVAPSAWALPVLDLLAPAPPPEETARPDNALRANLIVETLASFGVDARVAQYHEGPVVTQFDVEPGWEVKYRTLQERDKENKLILDKDGRPKTRTEEVSRTRVRVNQITSLANDMALALAAPSLRIEAPVPGRSVVGIEVPNTSATVVTLRSVIETPAFQRLAAKTKIALPLGKSVSGDPVVADLARMPHLLIAGATGAGKSVCINSIIASILMQARPDEVRFVMIDPKRVELSSFSMIPHLAFSNIVVDMEKVVGTLGAVLHEMEERYKRFASLAVRNIESYNKHPKVTERLPYWVVIIDELADLMMAAPFEVERQICRLAQLARATGIHLIVATQRPSVDVVTGLIKANFPTRIAFAMTSQVDSRTILDMAGAERLLGRGDMLYMPTDASKPRRVQGVYVSDAEIDRLVAFWTGQRLTHPTPVYDHLLDEAMQSIEEEEDADPMYERAKTLAEEHSRVSTSMLQRRLRIGYPRAARIMDRLEEEGIVGAKGLGGSGDSRAVLGDEDDVPF